MSYDCHKCGGDLTGMGGPPCICNKNRMSKTPEQKVKPNTCDTCFYWDVSCYECDHPKNRINDDSDPEYRIVRRCGPKFGCIFFKLKFNQEI